SSPMSRPPHAKPQNANPTVRSLYHESERVERDLTDKLPHRSEKITAAKKGVVFVAQWTKDANQRTPPAKNFPAITSVLISIPGGAEKRGSVPRRGLSGLGFTLCIFFV